MPYTDPHFANLPPRRTFWQRLVDRLVRLLNRS